MNDDYSNCPRVLVLTSNFPCEENKDTGAFIFQLCNRLSSRFDITVLSPRTPASKRQETMSGLRVIRFPYFFQTWEKLAMHGGGILNRLQSNPLNYLLVPLFLFGQMRVIISLLRKEKFDLIHAHWLIPQGLTAALVMAIMQRRIPMLCTSHGGDIFALRGVLIQRLRRWIMNRSRKLAVVSQAMQRVVVDMGNSEDKVHVLSMGVDLQQCFRPDSRRNRSDLELLFVGRLVEVKGVRILLEAMPRVLVKHPDVFLTIAGDGPLETELKELARRLGIDNKINFCGMLPQSELPELYQRAALAVFPFVVTRTGVQEGFGLVVVEAMGCECPVIAGDLPAIRDSITHGENGLLVPSGNSEALADSIIQALDDRGVRTQLAREGRKRVVEKYDWEVVAKKYSQLYDKILENKL